MFPRISDRALHRVRFVAASFHAVATSPAMPGWATYQARVERERSLTSAFEEPTLDGLVEAAGERALKVPSDAAAVIGSLVSFADDHFVELPERCFPSAEALALIERLRGCAPHSITPARLLGLAVGETVDAFGALCACHLATRQLARGRDARAFGASSLSLHERCDAGLAIAPFPPSIACGGDPLGDTYHYFANVIAGVVSASDGPVRGACIAGLFYLGPTLMSLVRERAFGSRLFYGNHARVDRLGLAHGIALGQRRVRGEAK